MQRKRRSVMLLSVCMAVLFLLASCGNKGGNVVDNNGNAESDKESTQKKVTVTTSFLRDMVEQLAKGKVRLETIIPAGDDPHLYLAKADDYNKINDADLVLYHGLHFEGRMVEILEKRGVAVSKNFDPEKLGRMEENGAMIVDPHFWFDLSLYREAVSVVKEELSNLLPEEAENIEARYQEYDRQLAELDEYNKRELAQIPEGSRYLITPHDAFNYFARSYNMEVMAPQGVSTDSEVSLTDINKTVDFIVEHKIKAIFAESTTDPARMSALQEAAQTKGFTVKVVSGEGEELFSDSLAPQGQKGETFIDMYKHNVDLIVKYLR